MGIPKIELEYVEAQENLIKGAIKDLENVRDGIDDVESCIGRWNHLLAIFTEHKPQGN